jgi:hypothetical protein
MPSDWGSRHFEVRQAQWTGFLRTFRQLNSRDGRPRLWSIWVTGDRFFVEHGLLGGKMQQTSHQGKLKNAGKANEITPEQDALAEARRECRKQWDFGGYDEFVGELNIDQRSAGAGAIPSIPHLLSSLPGSFSMYKPDNNLMTCKGLLKKAESGKAMYTLKRNGLAMWVVIDGQGLVHMYSRRNRPSHKNEGPIEQDDGTLFYGEVVPWVQRFPYLVQAVSLLCLPPYSMLACELVSPDGDEKDHFAHVQSVEKSLTPAALEKQEKKGYLGLYVWDVPFYDGRDLVRTTKTKDRYHLIKQLTDRLENQPGSLPKKLINPIQYFSFSSTEDAVDYAKKNRLEGWVVVDPEGIYGDRGWNLRGKPDRPSKFCAKLKPEWEDDFVAIFDPDNGWGRWGTGKREPGKKVKIKQADGSYAEVVHGGVGSIGLGQYKDGQLHYICDMGSGMVDDFCARLDPQKSFPFVCEVKYNDRSWTALGDKTDALSFPVIVRVREDKKPEECVYTPPEKV